MLKCFEQIWANTARSHSALCPCGCGALGQATKQIQCVVKPWTGGLASLPPSQLFAGSCRASEEDISSLPSCSPWAPSVWSWCCSMPLCHQNLNYECGCFGAPSSASSKSHETFRHLTEAASRLTDEVLLSGYKLQGQICHGLCCQGLGFLGHRGKGKGKLPAQKLRKVRDAAASVPVVKLRESR